MEIKRYSLLISLLLTTVISLSCHNDDDPEGKLVFSRLDSHTYLYDLNDDSELLLDPEISGYNNFFSGTYFSPNRRFLAYVVKRSPENIEDIFIRSIDGSILLEIPNPLNVESRIERITWSPNSNKLAYRIGFNSIIEPAVYVIDIESGGNVKVSADNPQLTFIDYLQWSPDGRFLNMVINDVNNDIGLDVYDTQQLSTVRVDSGLSVNLYGGVKWSFDSQQLIFLSDQDLAGTYDLIIASADGSERLKLTDQFDGNKYIDSFYWSGTGDKIAYARKPLVNNFCIVARDIYTIDASGLSNIKVDNPDPNELDVCLYEWAPNSDDIYFTAANADSAFDLFSVNSDGSGQLKINDKAINDNVGSFKFSPDGSSLAYLSSEPGSFQVDLVVIDLDTQAQIIASTGIEGTNRILPDFFWSPDSRFISYNIDDYSAHYSVYVADINRNINTLLDNNARTANYSEMVWSPDSKYIAYKIGDDGEVKISNPYGKEYKIISPYADVIGWVN